MAGTETEGERSQERAHLGSCYSRGGDLSTGTRMEETNLRTIVETETPRLRDYKGRAKGGRYVSQG